MGRWAGMGRTEPTGPAGATATGAPTAGGGPTVWVLFRRLGESPRRLASELAGMRPDVIHAHDWVTFEAARQASQQTGAPWAAPHHLSAHVRRPDAPAEVNPRN